MTQLLWGNNPLRCQWEFRGEGKGGFWEREKHAWERGEVAKVMDFTECDILAEILSCRAIRWVIRESGWNGLHEVFSPLFLLNISMLRVWVCVCLCVHVHVSVGMHVCMCTYACLCVRMCICVSRSAYIYVSVQVCVHVCVFNWCPHSDLTSS